jgi:hypothetical protein
MFGLEQKNIFGLGQDHGVQEQQQPEPAPVMLTAIVNILPEGDPNGPSMLGYITSLEPNGHGLFNVVDTHGDNLELPIERIEPIPADEVLFAINRYATIHAVMVDGIVDAKREGEK